MSSEAVVQIERAGFAVIPDILDEEEVCEVSRQLEFLGTANAGYLVFVSPIERTRV
jgi:hypothetical protein